MSWPLSPVMLLFRSYFSLLVWDGVSRFSPVWVAPLKPAWLRNTVSACAFVTPVEEYSK